MIRWAPAALVLIGVAAITLTALRGSGDARLVALGLGVFAAVLLVRLWRRPRVRTWHDAEAATARWLRKAGCRRVVMTKAGADGGLDVITADWAVQVKHTAKRVGRPAVQQLVGAALTVERSAALFSTSGFSAPAIEYAEQHQVALFELDYWGRAAGINQWSRRVGKRVRLRRR